MEALKNRYTILKKCFDTFSNALKLYSKPKPHEEHILFRDGIIQRFEYTIDTLLKFLRDYIEAIHGVPFTFVSPREILRVALQTNTITEQEFELLSQMIKDRNLTSHTYNEKLAQTLVDQFDLYHTTLNVLINRLNIH